MVNWLLKILNKQAEDEIYGSVTIYFQKGKVTHVDTKHTSKPPIDLNIET